MTTYAAIPDSDIDPESPGTATLFTRLRDNPIATVEGASGAPKMRLMAIEDLNAGETIRSRNDDELSSSTTASTHHAFQFMQIGTIRIASEHKTTNAAAASTLTFELIRNGVSTTIGEWTTTSTSYVARTADSDVLPGDFIKVVKSQAAVTFNTQIRNSRFKTNGENMWPGGVASLENDYTPI